MKNLKIWIALLLVVVFAMSFTACGTGGTNDKGNPSDQSESGEQTAISNSNDAVYGKITEITGNEIKVAIAKRPAEKERGEEDLKGEAITPNENDMPMIGGEEIEDSMDDLEFTGETKTFTVPAGVIITNMGQEINLSSLKKGDIISIMTDAESPDTLVSVDKVK